MSGPSRSCRRLRGPLLLHLAVRLCPPLGSTQLAAQAPPPEPSPHYKDQESPSSPPNAEDRPVDPKASAPQQEASSKKRAARGELVVAPLPVSSPAVGTGIIPVLGYISTLSTRDKISPPSVIGAAGLVTNNGSRGFGLGGQFYLKENAYQVTAGFVHGNLNYNFYGIGVTVAGQGRKIPLKQTGEAFFGEFLGRLGWKFFLGPRFISGSSDITLQPSISRPIQPPSDLGIQTTLRALGIRLLRDTRPNRFYPTTGTVLNFTADFFSQGLGSKYSFQSYAFTFNKYGSLSDKQVLAYNLYVCGTGGQPPFYGNCIYGTNNELRGYTAGQYLDRYMVATQLEYRLVLPKRFGLVAFGGIGAVAPGGDQLFGTKDFLPSGGGGLRFTLSKKFHVNLRADAAQGKSGHTWSMGVGEAF